MVQQGGHHHKKLAETVKWIFLEIRAVKSSQKGAALVRIDAEDGLLSLRIMQLLYQSLHLLSVW